ncbi:GntR family transcriptional regulator [Microbacterium halophytorum]|uniref:GntR family transcriptional regulator n=1 Tax=Microbacterium halophytorum TaxID=2067568 RepID=UPI000CFBE1BC|nr:GntR family transcriptional regulator [Microbacterium halophytorum]
MLIRIDPTREVPVFAQIAASIRADVVAGSVGPGDRLPSAKQVAASLGVNLHTVLHAYQQLREEGLVDMRPGRGAVVAAAAGPAAELRDDIGRIVARAASLGISRDALANLVRDASGGAGPGGARGEARTGFEPAAHIRPPIGAASGDALGAAPDEGVLRAEGAHATGGVR